jgi:hypothetical protein
MHFFFHEMNCSIGSQPDLASVLLLQMCPAYVNHTLPPVPIIDTRDSGALDHALLVALLALGISLLLPASLQLVKQLIITWFSRPSRFEDVSNEFAFDELMRLNLE